MKTQTTDSQELRRELLLSQAVSRHQDALVKFATKAVLLLTDSKMKTSQLRNAVNVAQQEGASYDLVANFIRYKIATQGDAWGKQRNSFGHTVIAHLDNEVRQEAQKASAWLKAQPNAEQLPRGDELEQDLYSRMLKRYMGYLVRSFAYYEKAEKDNREFARQMLEEATK
ncbi:hypothetical protein [Candidatus Chloroploca sp. Khr17]|uniref:hypothetical protein n=1 Tax=Candidatus Chloroploca sp. Khr17 TaxID=2496869 RepID=UPI00101CCE35|nr:hypothetical protein [Candidatus Chloroploca sp. Khr17]